ncbi:putative T7SS-secreted protein, partial [Streptomyces sp. URMC 123]|uniref:putative T7SS-secreted protein n=1 Tax=Streptomyces sp. URMC 123 TaxID=3423403 RepID=UPI003F1B9071
MNFGDFIPDAIEDYAEKNVERAGKLVDLGGKKIADGLDRLGHDTGAGIVRRLAGSAANALGADAGELELGQSDDPRKLIHGSVSKLRSTVSHLRDFHSSFDKVGNGLKGMDSAHWKGEAADAFREKVSIEPKKWFEAAQACGKAADALDAFADTVEWAQRRAREAIDTYRKAEAATDAARDAHNAAVASYNAAAKKYNAALDAGGDPGPKPTRPGDFADPGESGREAARAKLKEARAQRNTAAETARTAVRAARDAAPAKPSFADQVENGYENAKVAREHLRTGVIKGVGGLIGFVRSVSAWDPYNLAHPAEYATRLSALASGLVTTANNPWPVVKNMAEEFTKDPYEATGKLLPDLIGSKGAGSTRKVAGIARRLPEHAHGPGTALPHGTGLPDGIRQPHEPGAGGPHGPDPASGRQQGPGREQLDENGSQQNHTHDGKKCVGGTDPVDLATGKMFLPQTDVSLPGALPLAFTRRVESGYRAGRWFGPSWSSTVDERLEIDARGVVHIGADGRLLAYPHPAVDLPTLPERGPRWPLERTADGSYTLTDPATGHVRHFTGPAGGGDGEAPLEQMADRDGHWVTFEYDADGAPTGIAHSAGRRLRITTDGGRITALHLVGAAPDGSDQELVRYGYTDGDLTEVTKSSGRPLRFEYDDEHRVIAWTDTNDRRYDYVYDNRDRVIAEGGTDGHLALRIDYGAPDEATGLRTTTVTTAEGQVSRYVVNDACQVVATVDPLGHTIRTEYDRYDRVLSSTDALGRTYRFRYDEDGNLLAVLRPDGREQSAAYNDLGLPTELTGPDGAVWRQTYDEAGRRTSVTDPTGATTRFAYDDRGHPAAVTDAEGNTTRLRCDAAGLPVEITDALGGTTRYERDAFGRVTALTDPLGRVTRLFWTVEGRLSRCVDPDGAERTWTYDGEGNLLAHTDAAGGVTSYEYTHFDLVAARTGPDGVRHTFEHDAQLRLTRVTNPQGLTWQYAYDAAGRLVSETDFDGRVLTYDHDAADRLTARTNGLGQTVHYAYDDLGRLTTKAAEGHETHYAYDAAGRLVEARGPGVSLAQARDRLGRVTAETVNGRTLCLSYDRLGRRSRRITPSGATTRYGYDAAGRRTSLTASGHTVDFEHDAAGQEVARYFGETLTLTQAWDPAGRLAGQTLTARATTVQSRAYAYRPDGHVTAVDDRLSGRRSYDLDTAGRVTAVHARDWTERYAYDEAGNQTEAEWPAEHAGAEAVGTRAYTGTRIGRAGRVRYEHDAQGRVVLRRIARLSRKPDTWRYTWDAEDRLVGVVTPDGTRWRYLYDPLGRRIAKQRLGDDGSVVERTDFTWDGTTLAEQTTVACDAPNPVTLTWDHEGLRPIAQTERISAADAPQREIDARFFAIVTDLVGAPTELVDERGTVAWRARSTLWGTTTWPSDATAYTPLRFPGQYFDPETGLHYNVHRHYDPTTARYLTQDPLGLTPAPN